MDKYAYLVFDMCLCAALVLMLSSRKDLVKLTLKVGLLGGIVGLLSEIFYFRDYWRPPSLLGIARFSPEDFVFGLAITAIGLIVYPWLYRKHFTRPKYPEQHRLYLLMAIFFVVAMLFFNLYLGVNSIFVSSVALLALTAVIVLIRRDLVKISLYSAVIMACFIVGLYLVLSSRWLFSNYFNHYWLPIHAKWWFVTPGGIPLAEILWYFSWGSFISVSYLFYSGKSYSAKKFINREEIG